MCVARGFSFGFVDERGVVLFAEFIIPVLQTLIFKLPYKNQEKCCHHGVTVVFLVVVTDITRKNISL